MEFKIKKLSLFLVFFVFFFFTFNSGNVYAQNNDYGNVTKTRERARIHKETSSLPYRFGTTTPRQDISKMREEMRLKLEKIRDLNKRNTANNLLNELDRVNKRLTEQEKRHISKLEEMILRRENVLNQFGISEFNLQINEIKSKIKDLKDKITAQFEKDYSPSFDSEEKLKDVFQGKKQELINDHKNIRKGIDDLKNKIKDLSMQLRERILLNKTSTSQN